VTTWFILGAGYTGARLATRLVRGLQDGREGLDEVVVTRRKPGDVAGVVASYASPHVRGVALDLARPETLRGAIPDGAVVVCAAPPGDDPAGEIEALAAAAANARRFIYVSSTGVYGPGHGAWVDESAPVAPITSSGRARAAAEAALPETAIALRVAGIHGPGRGLVDRIRAGTYRIVGDGSSHVSRIHVVDLVEAIVCAAMKSVAGPVNIADDDPAPIGEVADEVAVAFGKDRPPRVDPAKVDPEVAGMLLADRRIANTRMKQVLGVALRYPSWRVALAEELAATPPKQ
jgi:nucleoside-diphosphate-sugar epimerase